MITFVVGLIIGLLIGRCFLRKNKTTIKKVEKENSTQRNYVDIVKAAINTVNRYGLKVECESNYRYIQILVGTSAKSIDEGIGYAAKCYNHDKTVELRQALWTKSNVSKQGDGVDDLRYNTITYISRQHFDEIYTCASNRQIRDAKIKLGIKDEEPEQYKYLD